MTATDAFGAVLRGDTLLTDGRHRRSFDDPAGVKRISPPVCRGVAYSNAIDAVADAPWLLSPFGVAHVLWL